MWNSVSTDPRAHTDTSAPQAGMTALAKSLAHSRLAEIKEGFGAGGFCAFPPIPIALPQVAGGPGQTARLEPC